MLFSPCSQSVCDSQGAVVCRELQPALLSALMQTTRLFPDVCDGTRCFCLHGGYKHPPTNHPKSWLQENVYVSKSVYLYCICVCPCICTHACLCVCICLVVSVWVKITGMCKGFHFLFYSKEGKAQTVSQQTTAIVWQLLDLQVINNAWVKF